MDRFGRVLRRVDRRLEAPEPERSRILMELAGDLENLYRAYRERGLEEAEARRRAEEWLVPSRMTLESLGAVHLPAFDRLLDRLGGTLRGRIELGLAAVVSLVATAAGVFGVLRSEALTPAAPGLWLVAGLGALGLGTGVRQLYPLFVRGDRLGPGWRRAVDRVLAAAAGTALAGRIAGVLRLTLTAALTGTGGASAPFWSQLSTAAGVAAVGLGASLLLSLLWLLLRVRVDLVSRARAELREMMESLEFEETALSREKRR